ncbi:MAG: hypothetical protein KF704_05740 [Crocinitomicaceae bacterium]|nr:hypothetical protein [Crocinitomicaceae bacterium]
MKYTICTILLAISFFSDAQDFYYASYDWTAVPDKYELTNEELKLDEVYLKRKDCIQLFISEERALEYRLSHKIIRLNTDKGIEHHNKWYLNHFGAVDVRFQKARVIKPNGDIVVQNASDIKEALNEDGEVEYKYFAFEGIEKGSTVEILELASFPARLTGASIRLQGASLYKNVDFEVISPDYLSYAFYAANDAPQLIEDTIAREGYRRLYVHLDEVKQLKEEDWAAYGANLKKIYYKLDKNLNTRKGNFYSYSDVTHNVHESLFSSMSKKESAALKKFLKSLDLNAIQDEEDKIRTIENEFKHGFYIVDQSIEKGNDIESILKNHIMSTSGFFRIFLNTLRELSIPYEIVLTCNRYEDKFSTKYEAYNFLNNYLLYFPNTGKYVSEELMSRYGFPPDELTFQKGLFIREIKVQDILTGVSEIKSIAYVPATESIDKLSVKLAFSDDKTENKITVERVTTGYKALPYQVPLDYMMEDQKKEVREEYLTYIDEGALLDEMTFKNDATTSFGKNPLIGKASFTSKNFIEKGGDKLLLKAGLLIGPQSELYNRESRLLPVESPHARIYDRVIEIEIPDGYSVKNLQDVAVNVVPFGATGSIGFVSSYIVDGNVLKINVKEWYNEIYFEATDYVSYETVINAAADFNKLILILQPK